MATKSLGSTKAITDPEKIHELLTRGVAEVYPSRDALREVLVSGKRLRIYNGIDPTAATLHIGHLASLQKLRQFQELGHEVIMLIGDFTGMIGDPTGKSKARVSLTREQVNENAKMYQEQASSVLTFAGKSAAKVRRNGEWWDGMTAQQLLETLSLTTAQRLLERDMFQERLKKGESIGAHELLYPALQGYDAVAMEVDVEIGGSDQMFNMLMGRDYVRKMQQREKFVITVPLLADAAGKKIGKSEGNMVELGADPENLFGQAMALPDGVMVACFEQCTAVPMAKVAEVRERLAKGENPRDCKMELASEFVRMRYGAEAADRAQAAFVKTFQKHETPEEVQTKSLRELRLGSPVPLSTLLVRAGLASSSSDARRLIKQGGVKIDGQVFKVADAIFNFKDHPTGILIQKGKRHFVRVIAT
ncbi:MAG: tyrosine--tRNA ligase [bacterium]|nr:tyrosine--tRNA ligase [bacterium]